MDFWSPDGHVPWDTDDAEAIQVANAEIRQVAQALHDIRPTELKPSNPKDVIGSDKIPFHLWPETATMMGALGLLSGMLKYGRTNWRVVGVRYSIYLDAARRHMAKLWEGEDVDEESGLPHECHILACFAILIDAKAAKKLTDDRQVLGGFTELLQEMTPHVRRLKEQYADHTPRHYTIADNALVTQTFQQEGDR